MKLPTKFFWNALVFVLGTGFVQADDFTNEQIVETWGWIIAQKQNVAKIEIDEAELSMFLKGVTAGVKGQPAPHDLQKIYPDVERLAKARREKIVLMIKQKNLAAAEAFFVGLKKNPHIVELPDGVRYEIVQPGKGPCPKPEQTVNVHYTGRLIDGTEFTQMGPIDMVLVPNRSVCRGWIETMRRLHRGGAMKLYVPPPLPEGDDVRLGIPPGSAIVYEIELLDIKDTSPEDLANNLLPPAPESELPPSGFNDMQIIETWGWTVAQETGASRFGLGEAELSALLKGLATGIEGGPAPSDLKKIYPAVQQFVTACREKVRLATRQKRLDEMNALFAGLKKNKNVVELPDGLRYEIIQPGSGPHPKPGQIVLVDYTGRLINGTVFDKTYNEPLHIEVGSVILGWNEGIQKIGKGGKIKLYIPPSIGYGDENMSGVVAPILADSTLIYEIELLDIQEADRGRAAPAIEKK